MAMGMAQSSDKHLLQGQTITKSGMKEDNPTPLTVSQDEPIFFFKWPSEENQWTKSFVGFL